MAAAIEHSRGRRAAMPRGSALAELPAALVIGLATLVGMLTIADLVGARLLAHSWWCRALLAALVVLIAVAARWLSRAVRPADRTGRWALPVPGLLLTAYAVSLLLPAGRRLGWFLQSGDSVRHVVEAARLVESGGLAYDSVDVYPRAWHSLVALVWESMPSSARDLPGLLETTAAAFWASYAVLAAATGLLAGALAAAAGSGPRARAAAVLLGSTLPLLPGVSVTYLVPGFQTSVLAAVVLAVVVREVVGHADRWRATVVAASGVVVVAHTWQLVLPVAGIAACYCALRLVARVGVWSLGPLLVLAGGTASLSLPPIVAVVTGLGLEAASVPSDLPTLSLAWPLLVLPACVWVLVAARGRPGTHGALRIALALVAIPALIGMVLAVRGGLSPQAYYPAKIVGHTSTLGLAGVAAAGALIVGRVGAGLVRTALLAGAAVVGAAGTLVTLALPLGAFGSGAPVDGALVLRALRSPSAATAQAFWVGRPLETAVVRGLSYAFDPPSAPILLANELSVEEECALLSAASEPSVLTTRSLEQTAARYGCAPGADLAVVGSH